MRGADVGLTSHWLPLLLQRLPWGRGVTAAGKQDLPGVLGVGEAPRGGGRLNRVGWGGLQSQPEPEAGVGETERLPQTPNLLCCL